MKKVNGHEVIQLMEQIAPKTYALEGDRIGLQIGRLNKKVERIMIALDVIEEVVDDAIEQKIDLIIAHHPLIFQPLKSIRTDVGQGKLIEKLIKHDITVYAAHTNLDVAKGGVNDMLAAALRLQDTELLIPTMETKLKKLAVFVPEENASDVRKALGAAGAGAIGQYSHCTFSISGLGRFLPGENTNPHLGEKGRLESVQEVRIETIYPVDVEKKVLTAMLKAHPYEEVAYDMYPLDNKGEVLGLGRIGQLEQEMSLAEFAEHVKTKLDVKGVRVVGNLSEKVKKVAVLGGDGNKYVSQAKFKGADVYVTGDMYYHTAHDAKAMGLNIVDPGHHIEQVMKQGVTSLLSELCSKKNYDVTIVPSKVNTDPFQFI